MKTLHKVKILQEQILQAFNCSNFKYYLWEDTKISRQVYPFAHWKYGTEYAEKYKCFLQLTTNLVYLLHLR